ncbi:MAG: hypothetical protein IKK14_01545 [Oscillospiraceae bacterium]|nr:hypothetical protein [Oscillospiraceae bacterium]
MQDLDKIPGWFFGANAPKGYFTRFDQLFSEAPNGKCFLLKGGPGTGKSTMLKKIASVLMEKGLSTEVFYCSADPGSLDAVVTSDGKFVAVDATLPHAAEPKYPGAYEKTLDLSDCWNEKNLREHKKEIASLFDSNRRLHEEARRYLSAAANLLEEAGRLGAESLFFGKTENAALKICAREIGKKDKKRGTEKQRFLSAVTESGVVFMNRTPEILCERIFAFEDETGAASRIFMNTVRKYALENGFDVITCKCPLFPSEKTEHIFIPSLKLGFITSNKRHSADIKVKRTIHSSRFYDPKKYSRHKIRIRFALRLASSLIGEAALCMKEAKSLHDELEYFYIKEMDFSLVEEKTAKILDLI